MAQLQMQNYWSIKTEESPHPISFALQKNDQ